MHDFHCQNAKDMVSPLLADEVRALKETEGGKRHMCRLLEEMREEAAAAEAARRDKDVYKRQNRVCGFVYSDFTISTE